MSDPHDIPIGYGNCDGCWRHKSGALWFDPTCPVHSPTPTEPGTPQTAAGRDAMRWLQTRAWLENILAIEAEARAAHDAEVRALEYAARNVVAAWKLPNLANAMAFDGLVEALRAILDADTPS